MPVRVQYNIPSRSLQISDIMPLRLGLLCDLLWSDPDKDVTGWSENDRGVSFTFGRDVVQRFLQKQDMDLICRAHQVRALIWSARHTAFSRNSDVLG